MGDDHRHGIVGRPSTSLESRWGTTTAHYFRWGLGVLQRHPGRAFYVSPTQINALAPAGIAPGPVQVIVQADGVSSNPFTITATTTLPAVYALPNADGREFFVTAALAGTATLVGNSAVDSRVLRAAQPGDALDLYMIG